jgi:hypothetical protein
MGQYAESKTIVAVELTMKELRAWLTANEKKYKNSDYPSTPSGEFELVTDWASHSRVSSSVKPFTALDYDDDTFGKIYIGISIVGSSISTGYEDGADTVAKDLVSLTNGSVKLQALFPKKKLKIVSLVTVG